MLPDANAFNPAVSWDICVSHVACASAMRVQNLLWAWHPMLADVSIVYARTPTQAVPWANDMNTTPSKIEVLAQRKAFNGYFEVHEYILRHELFAGGMSAELTREVFERGRVVAVLPVDVAREKVVLIEQFRPGAYAADWQPWLLECVAGVVEEGEKNEDVARRETMEEANCEVKALVPIARYLSSPGACSETVDLYCARINAPDSVGIHGLESEGEDIRVSAISIQSAFDLLERGAFVNAKTIIAMQWLKLHWDELKARWTTTRE